jgi:hypothetical protein
MTPARMSAKRPERYGLPLSEIASVLVRFNHIAGSIVSTNHSANVTHWKTCADQKADRDD